MSINAALSMFYGDVVGKVMVNTQKSSIVSSVFYGDAEVSINTALSMFHGDIDVSVKSLSALVNVLRYHQCSMVTLR